MVVAGADSAIRIVDVYDYVPGEKTRERPVTPSIRCVVLPPLLLALLALVRGRGSACLGPNRAGNSPLTPSFAHRNAPMPNEPGYAMSSPTARRPASPPRMLSVHD